MGFLDSLFGKPSAPAFGDFTPLIAHARAGRRREVARMIAAWGDTGLYLPLAKALKGVPDNRVMRASGEMPVACHCIFDPGGRRFAAAFSREAWLAEFGARARWATDEGPLRHVQMATPHALQVVASSAPPLAGVAINPGRPEELLLETDEILELVQGTAIPIERYCPDRVAPGERVLIGEPATPPADAFVRRLAELVAGEPLVASHAIRQHYIPEHHRRPRMLVELRLAERGVGEPARAAIAGRIGEGLSAQAGPGEGFEITFAEPPAG